MSAAKVPKTRPVLLAGLALGVLSALPVVNLLNACCCLWVIGGGALAAYLLQQDTPGPIDVGDGALVGLLAGLVGGFVATLVSIPIKLMLGPFMADMMRATMERMGAMPPEMRDMFLRMSGSAIGIGVIISLISWIFIGAIFGTIGGILGATIFRKKTPPAADQPAPTTAM